MNGAQVVARARALVGAPFALHGRDPRFGIDCVGLAMLALGRAQAPVRYGLRACVEQVEGWLCAAGLRPAEVGVAGDLAVVRPSPVQLHLMIWTGGGFVHAHGGLGRVVEMPGESPWPVIGWWRAD
jgi:lipoprotein Spr